MIPIDLVDAVLQEGLGEEVPLEERAFWHATYNTIGGCPDGRAELLPPGETSTRATR